MSGNSQIATFIEFNHKYIVVETELLEIAEFVSSIYRHMISREGGHLVGRISVERLGDEYSLSTSGVANVTVAELPALFPQIVDDVALLFMKANEDLCWVHAGAVESGGVATIFPGASGQGKSTLSTRLVDQGWRFISDDIAPIRVDQNTILPFPQSPQPRVLSATDGKPLMLGHLDREFVALDRTVVCMAPVEVKFVIFPEFVAEECTQLTALTAGEAALELIRNVRTSEHQKRTAVEAAVSIAMKVDAFRLQYCNADDAVRALVNAIE